MCMMCNTCCGYRYLRYYAVIIHCITYNCPVFTSPNSFVLSLVLHLSKSDLTRYFLILPFKSSFWGFMSEFIQQKCSYPIVLFTYRIATMIMIRFRGNRGFANANLICVQCSRSLKYISRFGSNVQELCVGVASGYRTKLFHYRDLRSVGTVISKFLDYSRSFPEALTPL